MLKSGSETPTVDEASLTADGNLLTVDGIEIFAKKMFPVSTVDVSPSTVDALHRPSLTVFELGFLSSVRLTFLRSETCFILYIIILISFTLSVFKNEKFEI